MGGNTLGGVRVHRLGSDEVDALVAALALVHAAVPHPKVILPSLDEARHAGAVERIANREAWTYARAFWPFRGSNLWAEWDWLSYDKEPLFRYTVFSYRRTWPLLVFDLSSLTWSACSEKISRTTTRHMQQIRPEWFRPSYFDNETMIEISRQGYTKALARRIERT